MKFSFTEETIYDDDSNYNGTLYGMRPVPFTFAMQITFCGDPGIPEKYSNPIVSKLGVKIGQGLSINVVKDFIV